MEKRVEVSGRFLYHHYTAFVVVCTISHKTAQNLRKRIEELNHEANRMFRYFLVFSKASPRNMRRLEGWRDWGVGSRERNVLS